MNSDIEKEIDWKTPEKQAEVRRMWADNPAMERDKKAQHSDDDWYPEEYPNEWSGDVFYYRPTQKPCEKTQKELDKEAYDKWIRSEGPISGGFQTVWIAACAYAREASRKGVA